MIVELLFRRSLPFLSVEDEVGEEGSEEGVGRVKCNGRVGERVPVWMWGKPEEQEVTVCQLPLDLSLARLLTSYSSSAGGISRRTREELRQAQLAQLHKSAKALARLQILSTS